MRPPSNLVQGDLMSKKLIATLIAIVGAGFLAKIVLKNKFEN